MNFPIKRSHGNVTNVVRAIPQAPLNRQSPNIAHKIKSTISTCYTFGRYHDIFKRKYHAIFDIYDIYDMLLVFTNISNSCISNTNCPSP